MTAGRTEPVGRSWVTLTYSAERQEGHTLYVVCHRERVERAQSGQPVAVPGERGDVPAECRGIARHVDHPVGPTPRDAVHDEPPGALARRVEHHHVRPAIADAV